MPPRRYTNGMAGPIPFIRKSGPDRALHRWAFYRRHLLRVHRTAIQIPVSPRSMSSTAGDSMKYLTTPIFCGSARYFTSPSSMA